MLIIFSNTNRCSQKCAFLSKQTHILALIVCQSTNQSNQSINRTCTVAKSCGDPRKPNQALMQY